MMADTEIMQPRFDQFRCQFSVRSRNRHDSAAGHTGRSTTLVHINMSCFSTQNTIKRTCHCLQSYSVRPRSVKNKKRRCHFAKHFSYFRCSCCCPGIVTISYCMIIVRLYHSIHHQRMNARIIITCKTSHFRLEFCAKSNKNKREHLLDTPVYFFTYLF